MIVLTLQNVVKEYNGNPLFDPISFDVKENDRIALVGANGTGKSTIIKMIIGEEESTKGDIVLSKGVSFGYLSQDVISSLENTLYEECKAVFNNLISEEKELNNLLEQIAKYPNKNELVDEYGTREENFRHNGGYDYNYKITMILKTFGFKDEEFSRKITSFSGGERTKMAFAKLLLIKPDILILDEPTNHLDIETIEWLETYLKSYNGAILFVSHDRYFMNAICNRVIEIENKVAKSYNGDYESFVKQKQDNYERQLKEFNVQQKEIAKIKRFIEFYMPKPRFTSRAQDRVKKLARIKPIEKPKTFNKKISIDFKGFTNIGKNQLEINNLSIGYDEPLIKNINTLILGGDRIAVMGNNGCGKTTFINAIINNKYILEGNIRKVVPVSIGYIKQNDFDFEDVTIFDYFYHLKPEIKAQFVYDHLARFGFEYEDKDKSCLVLSGGEKMRLILAKLVLEEHDILILDEPTNHLDMLTKEQLISALKEYQGTIIFVTHDRYFANEIANKIFFISQKKMYISESSYNEFKEEVLDKINNIQADKPAEENKRIQVEKKKSSLSPAKIEDKMAKIEAKIDNLKQQEFLEENYMDSSKMKALDEEIKQLNEEYEQLFSLLN